MLTAKSVLDRRMKNHTTGLNTTQSCIPFMRSLWLQTWSAAWVALTRMSGHISPRNSKEVAVPGAAGEYLIGAEIARRYRWFGMRATKRGGMQDLDKERSLVGQEASCSRNADHDHGSLTGVSCFDRQIGRSESQLQPKV